MHIPIHPITVLKTAAEIIKSSYPYKKINVIKKRKQPIAPM